MILNVQLVEQDCTKSTQEADTFCIEGGLCLAGEEMTKEASGKDDTECATCGTGFYKVDPEIPSALKEVYVSRRRND